MTSDLGLLLDNNYIFLYKGEGSGEGSREEILHYSAMGGFGNIAPFANTCAKYWSLRWSVWRSFWVSFGAVSWRCLGGGFGGVLEVDSGSLGGRFDVS